MKVARHRDGGRGQTSISIGSKLPPGPGRSREEVAASQRGRLRAAMIELVAERGYEAVTVRELAARAGVSQRALYEHFASKEECFLDTYEVIVRHGVRGALAAHRREATPRARLRLGVDALVREVAREPQAAHFALVDCFSAWPRSLARLARTGGLFDALLADSVARAPESGVSLPPHLSKAIVAGIAGVVRERLLTGREGELPELGGELSTWALSLLDGRAAGLGRLYEREAPAPPAPLLDGPQMALDERSVLLAATARLAAEDGFGELTVPRIRAAAGVSRRSFDAHFEGVTDCFLAMVEQGCRQALAHAARAGAASEDWPAAICQVLAAFCGLGRDERLAKMMFVEIFAPGPAGLRCRSRLLAQMAREFQLSAPAGRRPTLVAAEASIEGIWGLAYAEITAGRGQQLSRIAGILAFIALAPALGATAAAEAIAAERSSGDKK